MYKYRGRVLNVREEIIEPKDGGDSWKKMYFTIEESDSGFHHKYQFEIFGEHAIDLIKDNVKQDRFVNVDFYIKSREWKNKFYYSLVAKEVRMEDPIEMPDLSYIKEEKEDEKQLPF